MDRRAEPSVRFERSPARCPYCKGDLVDLTKIIGCAACGARHHADCFWENTRCASCAARAPLVPAGYSPRVPPPPVPRSSSAPQFPEGIDPVTGFPFPWIFASALALFLILPLGFALQLGQGEVPVDASLKRVFASLTCGLGVLLLAARYDRRRGARVR